MCSTIELGTLPDWLAAGATLAAVGVALWLALAPARRVERARPVLSVVVGDAEPFLRPVKTGAGELIGDMRLRVRVANSGQTPAYGVTAKLVRWWEQDQGRALGAEWLELDTEPLPMHWVSLRPGDDRTAPPETSIVNGGDDLLDVAILRRGGNVELLLDDDRLALFERATSARTGTWRVEFSLAGANCEAARHTIEFTSDGLNYFTAVRIAEPPEDAVPVGLLKLLRGLRAQEPSPDEPAG